VTERKPLSLTIPGPPARPGEAPDFSRLQVPQAGKVRRPAVDVDPNDIHDLAYSIVRVLNRQGQAVGPWPACARC
jgi:2-oxoisovalerate dehydrogenase E1 component alpha subunit